MKRFLILLVAIFAASIANSATAATGPWQGSDIFQARLISAVRAVGDDANIHAGLEFKLAEGWKVYWRSPGDAGLPTALDFSSSAAVDGHDLGFPAPIRFSILGFDSYGYKDEVIYPLTLELARAGQGFSTAARLSGLVCKDICLPVDETLTLSLPKGEAMPSVHAQRIAQARARIPSDGTRAGVSISHAAIAGDTLIIALEKDAKALTAFRGDIFIEAQNGYGFAAPRFNDGIVRISVSGKDAAELLGQAITVTAIDQDFMVEQVVAVSAGGERFIPSSGALFTIMAVALLGGIILNVMPCVLPVLSLKLSSVISHGDKSIRAIRQSFIVTAAGVIASFIALGLALLAMRSAGFAIGWGIQFQNPVFLIAAALAIGFFGLVMLDKITLPVPSLHILKVQKGLMGDFFSGALATILATPCSAPFVGTAIAFALAAPRLELMLIFVAMGVGLASPWLLIAVRPQLVQFLPRPGKWIIWLKRILALGLFATAFWLLSILGAHLGAASKEPLGDWQDWRPGLAESLAADGRIVFVDVTADWCITCQTNKVFVVNTDAIDAAFVENDVVLLRADWTLPDDAISAYLASFSRYGIPFNAIYGPRVLEGAPLPEILTSHSILAGIDAAAKLRQ